MIRLKKDIRIGRLAPFKCLRKLPTNQPTNGHNLLWKRENALVKIISRFGKLKHHFTLSHHQKSHTHEVPWTLCPANSTIEGVDGELQKQKGQRMMRKEYETCAEDYPVEFLLHIEQEITGDSSSPSQEKI